jgi:hypothetical protein
VQVSERKQHIKSMETRGDYSVNFVAHTTVKMAEEAKPFFDKMLAEKGNKVRFELAISAFVSSSSHANVVFFFFSRSRFFYSCVQTCVDCNDNNPQWASVSYGTFFCLVCSGKHRALGVHLSFVRSVGMDSWADDQLSAMMAGGNEPFRAYLRSYGVDPVNTPIPVKYNSALAEAYRNKIKCAIQGKPWTAPPKSAAADLLGGAAAPPAAASRNGSGNNGGGRAKADEETWDDWGDSGASASRSARNDDDEPPAVVRKTPAQYSSAAEAARLSRFEGSRGISSDSYFDEGDDDGSKSKKGAAANRAGAGGGSDDFFSSFTDGLSRLTATVADTVTTTAKQVGAKIDEAKPAEMFAGASKSVADGAVIGWSTVSSYWDKAKESVMTLADSNNKGKPSGSDNAEPVGQPAVAAKAAAAPPRKSSAAPAPAAAPVRKLAATDPAPESAIDDDFAAQLRAAQAEADALSAKRAARQGAEQQKQSAKPTQTRSRLAATEDDGDFFQGFGGDSGDNDVKPAARDDADDDAAPADDGGDNWDW